MYFRKFILNIKIVESKYFEILTYIFSKLFWKKDIDLMLFSLIHKNL